MASEGIFLNYTFHQVTLWLTTLQWFPVPLGENFRDFTWTLQPLLVQHSPLYFLPCPQLLFTLAFYQVLKEGKFCRMYFKDFVPALHPCWDDLGPCSG